MTWTRWYLTRELAREACKRYTHPDLKRAPHWWRARPVRVRITVEEIG